MEWLERGIWILLVIFGVCLGLFDGRWMTGRRTEAALAHFFFLLSLWILGFKQRHKS